MIFIRTKCFNNVYFIVVRDISTVLTNIVDIVFFTLTSFAYLKIINSYNKNVNKDVIAYNSIFKLFQTLLIILVPRQAFWFLINF